MKISIVTNAFNQRRFVERCLDSVLNQTYPDLEYIVVDPGSTDGSTEILRAYRDRFPDRMTLIEEPDEGPADGLNKGFARATGDIFGYLNADDAYLPGCLDSAAAAFRAHDHADVIYADGYIVDGAGKTIKRAISPPKFTPRLYVCGALAVLQQSTFYRRPAFEEIGGFNTANKSSWDGELLLDMALAGKTLKKVPGYWSIFAIYEDSITGSQRLRDAYLADRRRNYAKVFGHPPTDWDRTMAKCLQHYYRFTHPSKLAIRLWEEVFGAPEPALRDT